MKTLPKCLLLPIDGSEAALKPIEFVRRLYTQLEDINMVLCHFMPPLPPLYDDAPGSAHLMREKRKFLASRNDDSHSVFAGARQALIRSGFSERLIQEFSQERQLSVARQACMLANLKKVDAVLVQKTVGSSLEGFLKGDPAVDLLHHCVVSPIWFIEGNADPARAAICVLNEDASLRIADHAAFMLADTRTRITILHGAKNVMKAVTVPAENLESTLEWWFKSEPGRSVRTFLLRACEIVRKAGIEAGRITVSLIPGRGNPAEGILSYCREQGIGIVALGHSEPSGIWSFLKNSVTRKILLDFKNMAVWVNQ